MRVILLCGLLLCTGAFGVESEARPVHITLSDGRTMTDENSRKLIRFFTSTCIFNLNQTSVEYVIETALALNGDPVAREKIEMMVAACIQTLFDLNGLTLSAPQRE